MAEKATSSSTAEVPEVESLTPAGEAGGRSSSVVAVLRGAPFTARVRRPIHKKPQADGGDEAAAQEELPLEEVVRVTVTLQRHQFYHMNLFINKPTASEATSIASCPEFASAFNHTPLIDHPLPAHHHHHDLQQLRQQLAAAAEETKSCSSAADDHLHLHTTLFCVGISDIVAQLGLSLHTHLLLTFVPTGLFKDAPLTINDITIDLE